MRKFEESDNTFHKGKHYKQRELRQTVLKEVISIFYKYSICYSKITF